MKVSRVPRPRGVRRSILLLGALLAMACGEDGPAETGLPDLAGYQIVRTCRRSVEHDLSSVIIRVAPPLVETYETGPFPVGAVVVKEQYDDDACTRLGGYTLMHKEPPGYAPSRGDWRWQRLDAARRVVEDGPLPRCAGCHAQESCRARDFVCAER